MGKLIQRTRGTYVNDDAVENVIRYVTRTRAGEDRRNELIFFGGAGVAQEPEQMITQFKYIQRAFRSGANLGRKITHETFSFHQQEIQELDLDKLMKFAYRCAFYYYSLGYQVVYAMHYNENQDYHIHFAVNAVNYRNGKKWHSSMRDLAMREGLFNRYLYEAKNGLIPIQLCSQPFRSPVCFDLSSGRSRV